MMNPLQTLLIPALLGIASLSTGAYAGGEKKLTEHQIPKPVLEAFHKAYPQAQDVTYEEDTKSGKAAFEVEFKDQGIKREAIYDAEGTLLETEEGIKADTLPAAVTEALKKAYPHATVKEAEKVMKPDGSVGGYEVEIKEGKKELDVYLDEAGKILKTESD